MSQAKRKDNFTRQEVATILKNLRAEFKKEFGMQVPDYERVRNDLALEQRINEGSYDWMETSNKYTGRVSQIVPRLILKIHRHFGTIDNFTDIYYKPKRNWPLIIAISAGFGTMLYFANPQNQVAAQVWYGTGSNAYIVWGAALIIVLGFVYWRQKQKKQVQTGPP